MNSWIAASQAAGVVFLAAGAYCVAHDKNATGLAFVLAGGLAIGAAPNDSRWYSLLLGAN
ncbi:MAG: hypothetical protein F8N36_14010 [Desulfovibrio sp.]|uniref:hypothetical protein n=1 Tax=Desulfovibrio sp. TaxID=885 RepID=UPI00135D10DA|nr:hypothetical protein [Desulfovibrio sp.]MTJ93953.1 hypothetical protein [Desulfovibrio sp.]